MSTQDIIAAYPDVMPAKQSQSLPRLDRDMKPVLVLEGKAPITTGGDSGIGRSTVVMFAREGANRVTIAHLPEEIDDAKGAKRLIEEDGANCNCVDVDLRTTTLNVSASNASKQRFCGNLEDTDFKRGPSIFNTTSLVAYEYKASSSLMDYSSTTGAVVSFTCSLAVQLMPKGIRVNAVAPGPVYTVLQSGLRSPESVEGWGLSTAGQPIECGPSSVFLASSCDSNISTGQVVLVNSGMHVGGSSHRRESWAKPQEI